jgi:hypothetical protein
VYIKKLNTIHYWIIYLKNANNESIFINHFCFQIASLFQKIKWLSKQFYALLLIIFQLHHLIRNSQECPLQWITGYQSHFISSRIDWKHSWRQLSTCLLTKVIDLLHYFRGEMYHLDSRTSECKVTQRVPYDRLLEIVVHLLILSLWHYSHI